MAKRALEKGLAVVTGASSGIGYELAVCAAEEGYNLIVAADESDIETAAAQLRKFGGEVLAVQTDLSTPSGVDTLLASIATAGRPVDLLMANAGQGLGRQFLDQDFTRARRSLIPISSEPCI